MGYSTSFSGKPMNRLIERLPAALILALTLMCAVPAGAQAPPVLKNTDSRNVHGAAGTFDLKLSDVPSNPTTEPGVGPTHTIVFTFDGNVTAGTAAVTEGTATVGMPTFNQKKMSVPLTGVSDAQYVTVAVSNVSTASGGTGGSGSIRIGFLAGDVNQDRVVTLADVGLVNAQLAQLVTGSNYLTDLNADGAVTNSDLGVANANLTHVLPSPTAGQVPPPTALKRFSPASVAIGQSSVLTITLNPKLLYVPNSSDNTVSIVNSVDLAVVATIPVVWSPYYAAVAPYSGKVYVTHPDTTVNKVSVIDIASNAVTGTIAVGTAPAGIAVGPSGLYVYVANQSSGTVSVINTATNAVTATIAVGASPLHVAVNPAGTRLYVTNMGSNTVSVIDPANNSVIASTLVGTTPEAIAVAPSGNFVYVANANSRNVSVINATTNTVSATISAGVSPVGLALNPGGTKLYVADYSDSGVLVVDTATNTIAKTIWVAARPGGVSINPSGTKVFVSHSLTNAVTVIDTATNTVSGTITVGNGPNLQSYSIVAPFVGATTGAAFTDVYPAGMVNTNPASPATTCGGTVSAINGGNSLALSGGTIPANDGCNVTVNVTAPAGSYVNSTGATTTANAGPGPAASASLAVCGPPSITLTSPVDGQSVAAPATIVLSANASAGTSCSIQKVEFYNGSALLNTATTTPYSYTWTGVPTGAYILTAKAYNSFGAVTNSAPVNISVTPAGVLPALTALKSFAPATVASGATSVLTVTLNPKLLYVANFDANTISVLNTSTNAVLATIPTSAGPYYTAVDAGGKRVYVTNFNANTVSAIDTGTNSIIATIPVGVTPVGIGVNPAGNSAYVANYGGTTVSVLNTTTNSVSATITTGTNPINVALNSAGTRAYVTNFGSNNVSVINTATNAVIATVPVGINPRGVAVNAAGTLLYVANSSANSVSVINSATNLVTATIAVGAYPIGVSLNPSGTRAYVANYNANTVSVIDTSTNTVVATVPVGNHPAGVIVNLLGTRAYASNRGTNTLSVIDTSANAVLSTLTVGAGPWIQTNSLVAPFAGPASGVTFTDIYPVGLVNTATASAATTCGGTVTGVNGGNSVALSGGTIPANDSCTVTVNVTAPAGSYVNSTGAITTTNAGPGLAASASFAVCGPPSITLTSPTNGQTVTAPATIVLSANASAATGCTIQRVEFSHDGLPPLYTDTVAPYSYTWTGVGVGSYTIQGKAYDNLGQTASASVTVQVVTNRPPTITVTTPTGTRTTVNAPLTLTATASDPDTGDTITVQFFNDTTLLGTATGSGSNFSYGWTPAQSGVYLIHATVTDSHSLTASAYTTIIVQDTPAANITAPVLNSTVGAIGGTFAVSDSGAAAYSIPIQIPPGTAGMQPSLALSYSSQGGDGPLGVGWGLSGLSVIQRCQKTPPTDGYHQPINYDADTSNDAYCLDGERLIPVSVTGTSPGQTVEYRTERDSYSRIRSYEEVTLFQGNPFYGVSRFRVWTKSGQILDFGSRWWVITNGHLEANRVNSVKFWPLDQIGDRTGNKITIDYDSSPPPGNSNPVQRACQSALAQTSSFIAQGAYPYSAFYPSVIAYTINGGTARQFVQFIREARPDQSVTFDSGAGQSLLAERIIGINTYTNATWQTTSSGGGCTDTIDVYNPSSSTLVKQYQLSYQQSDASSRSRITSVKECDALGNCLAPTSFTWNTLQSGFATGSTPSLTPDNTNSFVADVDGDGKSDIVWSNGSTATVCLGGGPSCSNWSLLGYSPIACNGLIFVGDFNGDGRADFLYGAGNCGGSPYTQYWVCLTNATGTGIASCTLEPFALQSPLPNSPGNFSGSPRSFAVYGDFDGDGRIDIAFFLNNVPQDVYRVCLSRSTTSSATFTCYDVGGPRTVTNDGSQSPGGDGQVLIADINGDGRADLVQRMTNSDTDNQWRACLAQFGFSGGGGPRFDFTNGFLCSSNWLTLIKGKLDKLGVYDFNGDGMADLAVPVTSSEAGYFSGAWRVCLARGDGSFYDAATQTGCAEQLAGGQQFWHGPPAPRGAWDGSIEKAYFGDFNGDGRTDMAVYISPGVWELCLSQGTDFSCSDWTGPATVPNPNDPLKSVKIADFNGDGRSDVITINNGVASFFSKGGIGDLVTTITNGLGAQTKIIYKPLTDGSVYSRGSVSVAANEVLIQSPLYVVSSSDASDGNGGGQFVTNSYTYSGLKGRADGRGMLGFYQRTMVDPNGVQTVTTYDQTWPEQGRPALVQKFAPDSGSVLRLVNRVTNTYATRSTPRSTSFGSFNTFETFTVLSDAESWELNFYADPGTKLPLTRNAAPLSSWDANGNVSQMTVTTFDGPGGAAGYVKTTTNTYGDDTTNWILGRLLSSAVLSTLPNSLGSLTRNSQFTYYCISTEICPTMSQIGLLASETIEPTCFAGGCGDRTQGLKTTYNYDGFGNRNQTTVNFYEGATLRQRVSKATYDSSGRFPILAEQTGDPAAPIRIQERMSYDKRFGGVIAKTGADLIQSFNEYDGFGRKVRSSACKVSNPDPAVAVCNPNASAGLLGQTTTFWESAVSGVERYRVRQVTSGAPEKRVYFDELQRERRSEAANFSGTFVNATTTYDHLGRKTSVTKPYAANGGSISRTTTLTYDVLNRVTAETMPLGGSITSYAVIAHADAATGVTANRAKATVTRLNTGSGNEAMSRVANSQGQTVEVIEANGKSTTNAYDPVGNLICVTPSGYVAAQRRCNSTTRTGYQVAMEYDLRGRKVKMADPDMGTWTYTYSGVGELTTQTDPNAATTTQLYDGLGRMTTCTESRGTNFVTNWTYDNATTCSTSGLTKTGKTCSIAVAGGASKSLIYDDYGRAYRTTTTTVDTASVSRSFDSYALYDAKNRPNFTAYPQVATTVPLYGVRQAYNSSGYINLITEAATGTIHWQGNSRYDDGQAYQSTVGGLQVTRQYDTLARVASIVTPAVQNSSYFFDYLGNLTSRVDTRGDGVTYAESFGYDLLNRVTSETCSNAGICGTARTFGYDDFGSLTSKPGVSSIVLATNGHRLQSANGRSYGYDAAGNVSGDGVTSVVWTPFNMPDFISNTAGTRLDFRYDGGHGRTVENWSTGLLVLYVGSQFFEEQIKAGVTTGKAYIGSPDGVIGVVTIGTNGSLNRRYWYKDHLGSVMAERDSGSTAVVYLGYDEWGAHRPGFNPAAEATARGFTGHEHLDAFTLIHMNGRIYDPILGRFVSADPQIQDPFNPQNYNHYAYVLNNPLSLTDPTGFSWWTTWRRPILAIAAAVTMQYYLMPAILAASGFGLACTAEGGVILSEAGNAISAVASGFAAGGIQGGNLQSAVYGALTAAAFYGVGSLAGAHGLGGGDFLGPNHLAAIAGHAAVGCASSAAQGGSCKSGALSAGFAEFAGPIMPNPKEFGVGGLVGSAVAGGIGAELGGGKFQNGAVTGAFGYLFNAVSVKVDGNSVTMDIGIKYEGEGATADVINKFNSAIEKYWSGRFGDYDVKTTVQENDMNVIRVPAGSGRAFVSCVGCSTGSWPAENVGWVAAHEAGHLMGLPDLYFDRSGLSVAFPGAELNIMGQFWMKPVASDIGYILKLWPTK